MPPSKTESALASSASAASLPSTLEQLRRTPVPASHVLSVYLDTSPTRMLGEGFLLALRDQCKQLRERVPEPERAAFEAAVAQVERYLGTHFRPDGLGLALFATGSEAYWFATPLPARQREQVVWADRPYLEPLEAQLDEFERVAVLLFDAETARLYSVFLGAIEAQELIPSDVPGRQATGDWFGLAQSRYARHREDHLRRHAKRTIAALSALDRERPFGRLILGGPDEPLALLRHLLPRPLAARVAGTLGVGMYATDAEVLEAALLEATAMERRAESSIVEELLGHRTSTYVALGLSGVLAALNTGRVHVLVVSDQQTAAGGECPSCGALGTESLCGACGAALEPVRDFRDRLIQRALDQGARIEMVSGPASERLMEQEGVGAWTRY